MEFETVRIKIIDVNVIKCKFTPMEFETLDYQVYCLRRLGCKFTPMEFETPILTPNFKSSLCVNLLRWSLKLFILSILAMLDYTV